MKHGEYPAGANVSRVLVLGHSSAAAAGGRHARARWPEAQVATLAYGGARSRAELPRKLLSAVAGRRYDVTVVVQPRLGISRARGALLGLAALTGRGAPILVDPASGGATSISSWRALLDAARFAFIQAGSSALAAVATLLLRRWPASARAGGLEHAASGGSVTYLRTDLDLAMQPLRAGGSLAHTQGIVRALLGRGHTVELWTTGEIAGLPRQVQERRLPVVLRPNVPVEIAELLSGLVQAWRLATRTTRPRFVYQRYSLNNLAGVLLARRWGVPLVLEANASEVSWRRRWSALRFRRLATRAEQIVLRSSERILAVSDNAARDLLESGADPAAIRVVPNGVDVERFRDARPHPLPFPPEAFVVGFTGLFYPWHGTRDLAAAFALLRRRHPNARLLLVGEGEEAPLVRSILEREGAARDVLMTGLVPHDAVPGYLAAADVLVSPHIQDDDFIGSPIKVWEYMASGRAIVATRVAQIGEVIRDGETGLVVTPSDPEALAEALSTLHDDEQLRARLGGQAQEEAARRHSWDARLAAALVDDGSLDAAFAR